MKVARLSVVLVIVLGSVGAVRADPVAAVPQPTMSPIEPFSAHPPLRSCPSAVQHCPPSSLSDSGDLRVDICSPDVFGDSLFSTDRWGGLGSDGPRQATELVVQELPASPGSASLFLSAALSIGAWQLVRSARQIHVGPLPEWYHPGGPGQVGHAVAIDLQFAPLALCSFDEPAGERPYLYRVRRDQDARRDAQYVLIIAAPRGPPAPVF